MSYRHGPGVDERLERHRVELTAFCTRMLSPSEAEDAVQETLLRAWRGFDRFEGRSSLRAWLYRIARNVCVDMRGASQRRARPIDIGSGAEPVANDVHGLSAIAAFPPRSDGRVMGSASPEDAVIELVSARRAVVAALQNLPPKQRSVLILREVLRWRSCEVADLLETSVPSVNSALQRARRTLQATRMRPAPSPSTMRSRTAFGV